MYKSLLLNYLAREKVSPFDQVINDWLLLNYNYHPGFEWEDLAVVLASDPEHMRARAPKIYLLRLCDSHHRCQPDYTIGRFFVDP